MTETATTTLRLFSAGLLSKWGFNDGDEPDVWLDWCDERGIEYSALRSWRHHILPTLVRRHLLHALEQDVGLIDIGTNHNPIRAETVGGNDISDHWYDSDYELALTPEYIEVSMEQVLEVAREMP